MWIESPAKLFTVGVIAVGVGFAIVAGVISALSNVL